MKNILIFLCLLISIQINLFCQWVKCNDYYSINCFAVKDNYLFVGTDDAIYLTSDDGGKWIYILNTEIKSIAVKDSILIAGSFWNGIYLSTNDGESWNNIINNYPDMSVLVVGTSSNTLFAGTAYSGIYKSTDNGKSWKNASNNINIDAEIKSFALKDDRIYVGTNISGIYFSTDEGDNWVQINNGLTNMCIHTIIFKDTTILIGNHKGVSISYDNGLNWSVSNNGFDVQSDLWFNVWSLVINKNYIFAGTQGNGVYITSNNGDKWCEINEGLTESEVLSLAIKEPYIFAGTKNGVFRANINELLKTLDVNSDNVSVNNLNLSPNPASSSINVVYNIQSSGPAQIIITNSYGQQVYYANVNNDDASNEQRHTIDISTFPSGLYFVTLRSPAVALTKGVVVLK